MLSLAKLAELAKDKSSSARTNLVNALTDLFLAANDDDVDQVSLMFGDIVMKVLGRLEDEARLTLAKRVGGHQSAPHDLMVELAQDTGDIARPVLENSPVLECDDLVRVAQSASMVHLDAIAGRESVSEAVTDVLVDRGDDAVLTKVAENKGAHFGATAFNRLVEKARAVPGIQAALIERKDLPDDAARQLVPFLSEQLKERVKELGADNTLVQVMAERAAAEVTARARRLQESREQSNQVIRDVQSQKLKIDDAVQQFARSDRAAELGILLAKVSGLPSAAVSKLIYGKSDKALIIICKANGVSGIAFKDILTMRAKQLRLGGLELNAAIQRYAGMSFSSAKHSLDAIRASANKENAPADAEETGAKSGRARKRRNVPFAAQRG